VPPGRPQRRRAARRAQPLVEVAGPEVRLQRVQVDRQQPRGVGRVHQHRHAPCAQRRDQARERQQPGGRRGHLVQHRQPGPRVHLGQHRRAHLLVRGGERDRGGGRPGTDPCAGPPDGAGDRAVAVVGHQHLVTGRQRKGREHGTGSGGGVGDQRESVRVRAEEGRRAPPHLLDGRLPLAAEEAHRIGVHPRPPAVLLLLDRVRNGAVGAVVEMGDTGVQRPQRADPGPFEAAVHPCAHSVPGPGK
jgi:hypothetical protein